ncbi:hypothetical protein DH2020_015400 [Rehmannia glutinosa]|uniref:F-box domain-containing protein n=1 Tax=Rehmannia glutinosa TaxID=99300 RepID=A0ABR0WU61_REHGL
MIKKAKKRKTSENNRDEDIISSLPEHILYHILSFLPTKDAIKTSALSKTWNSAWKSFPIIIFDQYSFQDSRKHHKNLRKSVKDFCKYVQESINSRNNGDRTSIQKFQVTVNFYGRCSLVYRKYLDNWLNFAIENNVKELVLANYRTSGKNKDNRWRYVLPRSLFRASSLENLELFGCQFMEYSKLSYNNGIIGFSLKRLKLSQVYIDQETLQSVLSDCCHLLEQLSIVSCKGFQVVQVSNCPKLETVDLYLDREEVQIVSVLAPNLRSVSYGGGIESVQGSLMGSNKCYEKLKELKLHDTDITDVFFRVIGEFSRLEKLEINRCCLLESIRIFSDGLLELCVSDCVKLREIEFYAPCLRCFRYDGCHMHSFPGI